MITWIRSASIAPGQVGEAMAFVKQATALIERKHGIRIIVSRPIAGNPTRLFWSSQHDDLQAYARDHGTIGSDAEFLQMLGASSHCFIAGTTHDEILQTI